MHSRRANSQEEANDDDDYNFYEDGDFKLLLQWALSVPPKYWKMHDFVMPLMCKYLIIWNMRNIRAKATANPCWANDALQDSYQMVSHTHRSTDSPFTILFHGHFPLHITYFKTHPSYHKTPFYAKNHKFCLCPSIHNPLLHIYNIDLNFAHCKIKIKKKVSN